MPIGEIFSGQNHGWSIRCKLGEGDAGEVFLVESLVNHQEAILKRPRKNAFPSDIIRQANQINFEGRILRVLNGLTISFQDIYFHVPSLIDMSKSGTEYSDRFFIVIEKAKGINFKFLSASVINESIPEADPLMTLSKEEERILQSFMKHKLIPDLLLLKTFLGLLKFLEEIHSFSSYSPDLESQGFIWNDVKPDHLFWEPQSHLITIIDWGNSQPVEADGTTQDRRFSIVNDYSQFIHEMELLLNQVNPSLLSRLAWPEDIPRSNIYSETIKPLTVNLEALLIEETTKLHELKVQEESLLLSNNPSLESWEKLEQCQNQIIQMAELPDWAGAERLAIQISARFANEGDRSSFMSLCQKASQIPGTDPNLWEIVQKIAQLNPWPGLFTLPAQQALLSALEKDWPSTLWYLRLAAGETQLPNWWQNLCDQIRQTQPEIGNNCLTPLVVVNRLILTLQSQVMKRPQPSANDLVTEPQDRQNSLEPDLETLNRILKNSIARRWIELEPDPPNSSLEYTELEEQLEAVGFFQPAAKEALVKVIDQPKAIVQVILDSWGHREFETARRGLRRLLLWDPDRQRVFLADKAISKAPAWQDQVQKGPEPEESLQEFTTRLELRGREIRNQVGPANWLDQCLDAFSRLRKGASPADILLDYPELRIELPWLLYYHPPPLRPLTGPVQLNRLFMQSEIEWSLSGIRNGTIGSGGELILGEPLDTWASEARGSSARVFIGKLRSDNQEYFEAAIKIMRPGKADYAVPLFQEEVQILSLMKDVPGVKEPYEFGFIHLDDSSLLPEDDTSQSAREAHGAIIRINSQDIRTFLAELHLRTETGWLPYLALPKEEQENNLIHTCDAGYTHGRFLSIKENLRMVIQILDILQIAHSRNIVYRDHKILHYYWSEKENGVTIIDWNVARRAAQGLTLVEKNADLVQFGARALHHILTGRPAPGALPVGPTRPEEIDQAANAYSPQWNYDDQRLPTRLKDIIERALVGYYQQPSSLRDELAALFQELPDEA